MGRNVVIVELSEPTIGRHCASEKSPGIRWSPCACRSGQHVALEG